MRTYIHTYIHIYIHACVLTCMLTLFYVTSSYVNKHVLTYCFFSLLFTGVKKDH